MYCSNCGNKLGVDSKFCSGCGTKLDGVDQSNNNVLKADELPFSNDNVENSGEAGVIRNTPLKINISERHIFIQKVLLHFVGALIGFCIITYNLLGMDFALDLAYTMTDGYNWLFVLAAFMGVSYVADKWASSSTDRTTQYIGLGLFVLAESIIFLPILLLAEYYAPDVVYQAGFMTFFLVCAIFVFISRLPKSKKRLAMFDHLRWAGMIFGLGVIISAILFGLTLGFFFSLVMISIGAIALAYQIDVIVHHYDDEQYVGAALGLFASVMLIFWYMLRILIPTDE